jgi:hypothetical protein
MCGAIAVLHLYAFISRTVTIFVPLPLPTLSKGVRNDPSALTNTGTNIWSLAPTSDHTSLLQRDTFQCPKISDRIPTPPPPQYNAGNSLRRRRVAVCLFIPRFLSYDRNVSTFCTLPHSNWIFNLAMRRGIKNAKQRGVTFCFWQANWNLFYQT